MTDIDERQVLREALGIIEDRGHAQSGFWVEPDTGCVCIEEALALALDYELSRSPVDEWTDGRIPGCAARTAVLRNPEPDRGRFGRVSGWLSERLAALVVERRDWIGSWTLPRLNDKMESEEFLGLCAEIAGGDDG